MALPSPQISMVPPSSVSGDFAADGRRRLFASAAPGAFGPVAVLEPGDADLHAVLAAIGHGHALGVELLPAVLVVRIGGNGLLLVHLRFAGLHVAIDADRGGEEIALDALSAAAAWVIWMLISTLLCMISHSAE